MHLGVRNTPLSFRPFSQIKLDPATFHPVVTVYSEDDKTILEWVKKSGMLVHLLGQRPPVYPVGSNRGIWALWQTEFIFPEADIRTVDSRGWTIGRKLKEYNRAWVHLIEWFPPKTPFRY